MTPHPLVTQLRFTRREWVRGLGRVTAEEAAWMIGHLAWQEQRYFLELAQGTNGRGRGQAVRLRPAALTRRWKRDRSGETPGTRLHRTTYHYWFHLGESQAIRQLLGHTKLPTFVGGFAKSRYRPERS